MPPLREVALLGVGMTPFGRHAHIPFESLAHPAILEAMADAGVVRTDVQAAYCGSVFSGGSAGQRALKGLGMTGLPIVNVENACSSGSTAVREAWLAVASGVYDVVLVVGLDKLSSLGGGSLPLNQEDVEAAQGVTMPAVYAMRARRHMAEFGTTLEQLAKVAVKNHRHSVHNPMAQYRRTYSLEEVMNARPVADPLTLLHCCPTGDGAAAVVVAAMDAAPRFAGTPVRIRASVLQSGRFENGFRHMAKSDLTQRCAAAAYEMAGLGAGDMQVAEVHDAFTIAEIMYYEALGFCALGEGGRLLDDGGTEIGGRIPVNPSGGLLSKGHPLGATGVAQMVEIANQLRGRCGPRQVDGARIGLTHCTGGGLAGFDHVACTVHIFER